jgi:hypothetical protein
MVSRWSRCIAHMVPVLCGLFWYTHRAHLTVDAGNVNDALHRGGEAEQLGFSCQSMTDINRLVVVHMGFSLVLYSLRMYCTTMLRKIESYLRRDDAQRLHTMTGSRWPFSFRQLFS